MRAVRWAARGAVWHLELAHLRQRGQHGSHRCSHVYLLPFLVLRQVRGDEQGGEGCQRTQASAPRWVTHVPGVEGEAAQRAVQRGARLWQAPDAGLMQLEARELQGGGVWGGGGGRKRGKCE